MDFWPLTRGRGTARDRKSKNRTPTNPPLLRALESGRYERDGQNKPTAFKCSLFSGLQLITDRKSGDLSCEAAHYSGFWPASMIETKPKCPLE